MCGVPVHAAEAYLARLIKGRPPGRDRRADRKPGRGAQGARLQGAGRPRDRPPGHAGHADRGDVARIRPRPIGWRRSAGRATTGRSPPPTSRPAGSSWSPARPASSPPSWRGSSPAEVDRRRDRCRGSRTSAGKGGFDSLAGERALKDRFGLATLDGFGAPVARRACRRRRAARLSRRDPEGRRASCSTRRGGSPARATWRSTPRPATASS